MSARILLGDCREVMATLDAASVDAIVCDPPYGLSFMGKGWDHGVPGVEFWTAALRVAKPGAYLLAFGGTRTYHRLACAVEDAGWQIHDCLSWLYGSGFPKHASKLKPAWEPVVLARRPAPRATPLQIDACRVGDEVRVETPTDLTPCHGNRLGHVDTLGQRRPLAPVTYTGRWPANVVLDEEAAAALNAQSGELTSGRLQGHHKRSGDSRLGTFQMRERTGEPCDFGGDTGGASRFFYTAKASRSEREAGLDGVPERATRRYGEQGQGPQPQQTPRVERPARNHHPTVKPLALMRWLCRLVTPPGGVVLDPFCGSGSTGVAAKAEGFDFVGIEREPEYHAIAAARLVDAVGPLFADEVAS